MTAAETLEASSAGSDRNRDRHKKPTTTVRMEPDLRSRARAVLADDESMHAFVITAITREVERRESDSATTPAASTSARRQ